MAFEHKSVPRLTELTSQELSEMYADMRRRLEERYPQPFVSWFDDPTEPRCTCFREFSKGQKPYCVSYRYNPECKKCPDKSR